MKQNEDLRGRKRNLLISVCCTLLLAALVFVVRTPAAVRLFSALETAPAASRTADVSETVLHTPAASAQNEEGESALEEPSAQAPESQPASEPSGTEPSAPSQTEAPSASETQTQPAATSDPGTAGIPVMPTGSYKGRLSSAAETITYELTLSSRGALNYAITGNKADYAEWKAVLYQEYYPNGSGGETALRQINVLNAAAKNGKTEAPGIGLLPGNYVLRVSAGSTYAASEYTLDLRFNAGTEYEIEYNDSVTRYTELWPNIAVKGSASLYDVGRDEDWYLLRVYSDTTVDLLFTHAEKELSTVAFKIYLYNAELQELYAGNSLQSTASLSSGRVGLSAGTYFILVQARVYVDCEYALTVRRVNDTYETELNDTEESATTLFEGQDMRGALSARTNKTDRDWFVFTVDAPGYVTVFLKNLVSPEKSLGYVRRLSLKDAYGHTVWSTLIKDTDVRVDSPSVGFPAGSYYLLVDNDNLQQTDDPYEIGFSFTPSGGWEREFNGEPALATPLTADQTVSGTLSDNAAAFDEDWFTFTAQEEGTVLLTFAHDPLSGGNDYFNITLLSADLEPAGGLLVSYGNTETLTGSFTVTPGQYYVKVTSGKYKTDVRYRLTYSYEK